MPTTIIIGGGIAGLSAAHTLHKKGNDYLLLEASDRIGGRVKTDVIDGFRLDHGFQVLLTAYPEAQRLLQYSDLDLRFFEPGALLLYGNGKKDSIGDPLRSMSSLLPTLLSNAGSIFDKLKILSLRHRLSKLSVAQIFQQKEIPTYQVLKAHYGFSDKMIEQFFMPFFAGIFLEKELKTSRRMFDFVFKMFSENDTAVPNLGMEAIPKQIASSLPDDSIICEAKVVKIEKQTVFLADGSSFKGDNIIIATEATGFIQNIKPVKSTYHSTTHLHFLAEKAPITKPVIALNTTKNRLANNITVINQVAPKYAPDHQQLISISIVGKHHLNHQEQVKIIKTELKTWFGTQVDDWQHFHTRDIEYALPNQQSVQHQLERKQQLIGQHLYACGDFQLNGSINAAMKAGREVGELVSSL